MTFQHARFEDPALAETVEGWIKAHHDKDAARIMSFFSDAATTFSLAPPLVAPQDDIEGLIAWLSKWEGPVVIGLYDMTVRSSGGLAVSYGLMRMQATMPEQGDMDMWMRATIVFVRTETEWKIAHMHESVPFYMDGSFRAAVDLKPN